MLLIAFATIFVAASVLASPVQLETSITLPLKRVNHGKAAVELVKQGKARVNYSARNSTRVVSVPAKNIVASYVADVTVGSGTSPLILDTGSSITWIGAHQEYQPGPNSRDAKNGAILGYGSGFVVADEFIDTVTVGGVSVKAQEIGISLAACGFGSQTDGILGLGPVSLTKHTFPGGEVPTFLNNLYKDKTTSKEVFRGLLPSREWERQRNGSTELGKTDAGIIDTGTTLIYIHTAAYLAFLDASGAVADDATGSGQPHRKADYLIPKEQYGNFGLTDGSKYYAWIAPGGYEVDVQGRPNVDTIVGQKFLEHYYSVFDAENSRIGLAKAA
ncbi:hypothetical protein V2A60_008843 [Cordyceps javanica]